MDTGSTDRTKSICEEYGIRIFDNKWAKDFSEVRNAGISKASCDWILIVDADEELIISNPAGLRHYLYTAYDLISVRMTHFYGEKPADEKRAHFSGALRIARNDDTVRFSGVIHEKIDAGGKSIGEAAEVGRFIRILHYGYMEDTPGDNQDRNTQLLLKEKERQSDALWPSFYLASEHYRAGELEEAYREVNESISLFIGKGLRPPALAYKLKYDMIISLRYEAAYSGIEKAVTLYPDYVDLHLYKELMQYRQAEYSAGYVSILPASWGNEHGVSHPIRRWEFPSPILYRIVP